MQNDTANFYTVQDAFNSYWSGKPREKGKGFKAFKRWEWFTEQRVFPSGKRIESDIVNTNFQKFKETYTPTTRSTNGNWTSLGASTVPSSGGGAGRVSCVRFDPTNSNNVFIGTPAGGIWKSTNAGTTWSILNSEDFQSMGVYDIAIDPSNVNIIYIATGDVDGGDTYSVGILKSTNGGLTWLPTGLSWTTSSNKLIARILINPTTPTTILAATNTGVYRSTDAGVNWVNTLAGSYRDMEFKPGSPNTVYVCGSFFKYSTDGGITWLSSSATFPLINRLSMAVTAANPAYVYLLASNTGDNGFNSVMRSTDSGASFTTMSDYTTDPNYLGWADDGSDAGGQGWYDLSIAASPTTANTVFIGGVNIWKSTNGGSSFTFNADWTGWAQDYVHADIHDLQFANSSGSIIYAGCDGGVFKSTNTGTDWNDFSNTLCIGQMYRLGVSQTNATRTITGWQDNGTNFNNGVGVWDQVLGGDGMECLISSSTSATEYGSLYYGEIHKTTTTWGSSTEIVSSGGTGVDEDGNWITPYVQWAGNSTHLFLGKHQVYKSTNSGSTWTQVGTYPTGGLLNQVVVSPTSENYIYTARSNQLYVTTDGSTWVNRTAGLGTGTITYIAVSNVDPQKAWVTHSGFNAGEKVYQTTNAGVTWTNITSNLPNIPANCIVFQNSTSDGLYVGMDVGVYYKDASMTNWVLFNTNLPNTVIDELEIQYSSAKLRAATYGRGLWESDLFSSPTTAPVATFSADLTTTCVGIPITFMDLSTNIPTSWLWTFGASATPSTSTLQNPTVIYTAPGTYNVTLAATNGFGTGTTTTTSMITVLPQITSNVVTADQLYCVTSTGDTLEGPAPVGATGVFTYQWNRSYTSATTGFVPIGPATGLTHLPGTINQDIWFFREVSSGNCIDTSNVLFIDFVTLPPVIITNTSGTLTVPDNGYTYQWYLDGSPIPGETDTNCVVTVGGSYTCVETDTNGCTRSSNPLVITGINEITSTSDFNFWPNPASDNLNIEFKTDGIHKISLLNSVGQIVFTSMVNGIIQTSIPLNAVSKGLYYLQVNSGTSILTHKIIIANK